MSAHSKLIICPTPLGNLADAAPRVVESLASADLIACEDSRTTGKLLQLLGVERKARLVSYHEHNAGERSKEIADQMSASALTVVLVSDAGTPTISDPGFRLVQAVWKAGHEIVSVPGPVAAIAGLAASGLPTDRFTFVGFLPAKQKARQDELEPLCGNGTTFVGYESPHRVVELLEDLEELSPESTVYLGREISKMHEEHLKGSPAELLKRFHDDRPRGEFVFAVSPPPHDRGPADVAELDADRVIRELYEAGVHTKKIRTLVAEWFGISKSDVFDRLEALKSN